MHIEDVVPIQQVMLEKAPNGRYLNKMKANLCDPTESQHKKNGSMKLTNKTLHLKEFSRICVKKVKGAKMKTETI